MKKLLLLLLAVCVLPFSAVMAQSDKDIPAEVKNAFNAKYPGMKVTDWDWEEDKNMYEAEFKMNGREMEAYLSPEGSWLKTKSEIKREQLPPAVSKGMTSGDYSSWKMSDYKEMDTPEGKRFKVKAKNGNEEHYLKFDNNGTLLEKMDKRDKMKK